MVSIKIISRSSSLTRENVGVELVRGKLKIPRKQRSIKLRRRQS